MDGELWIHLLFGHLNELISWTFGLIWSKHSGELVNASPIFTLLLTLFLFSTHCFFLLITCFVWLIFLDLKFFNLPSQKDKSSKSVRLEKPEKLFSNQNVLRLKKKKQRPQFILLQTEVSMITIRLRQSILWEKCPGKEYLRLTDKVMKEEFGEYFCQNDSAWRGPEEQNLKLKHFFLRTQKLTLRHTATHTEAHTAMLSLLSPSPWQCLNNVPAAPWAQAPG